MKIFGKGDKVLKITSDTVPSRYGDGWYEMQYDKPRDNYHYEAQPDGTWLNITTQSQIEDNSDKVTIEDKFNNIMSLIDNLPVNSSITFMLIYNEIQEYHQHGTIGDLLLNVVNTSELTGQQVVNYLTPFFRGMKVAIGKTIGRRL